ncbi:MAG: hypothetical protein L3J36_12670 [Rhodobacteraceae bacterium]|nr:hypothetical protein [Paracoccaceae bacterium]
MKSPEENPRFMFYRSLLILLPTALALAAIAYWLYPRGPDAATIRAAYDTPLPAESAPLRVYHLGHSLVGRDMPAMLAQLAGSGHAYDSQLGWGTSLKEHWEPDLKINGFAQENDHARFRPASEAIGSGQYGAVVLTEMVELRDAIRSHDSAAYLSRWAGLARSAGPETQVYLYETWHRLDDDQGWLARLDKDLRRYWEDGVLLPDLRHSGSDRRPVRVIPAGQVMARFVRAIEQAGGVGNIADRYALFALEPSGKQDLIHLSDLGAYLVALTHYAVLYRRSPVGLPHRLMRADGSPADAPGPEAARLMQEIIWQVVREYPKTGVGS